MIDELKNHRGGVAGSLGEAPTSLYAYMEELERRIARLEDKDRRERES
ncbi:MAG: hypothetical protein IAI50_12230 [Candidatus Eremiobacteraeota bacterium]|nr:hypothetical protein [Candidatus Eremiobacteraeota bacterium]